VVRQANDANAGAIAIRVLTRAPSSRIDGKVRLASNKGPDAPNRSDW